MGSITAPQDNRQDLEMNDVRFPLFDSEQADEFVELLQIRLGPDFAGIFVNPASNLNHLVRFFYISGLCKERRTEKGLTFKQVSSQLKVPQYRLKAIEKNLIRNIIPEIFDRYIDFLGLQDEFKKWLKKNRDVYEQFGKKESEEEPNGDSPHIIKFDSGDRKHTDE